MLQQFKALADPTRLRLLAVLAQGEFTVQDLTTLLGLGQSRISRHLKIFIDAGLVSVRREGTWGYYRLGRSDALFCDLLPLLDKNWHCLPEYRADMTALTAFFEARRQKSREFFNRHARHWDELASRVLPTPDYRSPLLALVPSCSGLLEIGGGTGRLVAGLAARTKRLVEVDHSPVMLEEMAEVVASQGLANVDLRLGEMSHLPLRDGEVEAVVADMVLHHAPQPPAVLSEIARVMPVGGVLVLADLLRHDQDWAREQLADQWLGFESRDLQGWLAEAGFHRMTFQVVTGREEQSPVLLVRSEKR